MSDRPCGGSLRCRAFNAFGLAVKSDFPLPGIAAAAPDSKHRVQICLGERQDVLGCWTGGGIVIWETVLGDGVRLRCEVGAAGDHRFIYGDTWFHVDSTAERVLCATPDPADFAWQRQLLDTVLFSVSFARGFELLHASGVATSAGAAVFVGPTGAGKSTLAAELLRRGHRLLCDDVLALDGVGLSLMCFPAPAVMNLPEDRTRPHELGARLISSFPDENELWAVLPSAVTEPVPLPRIFLLDRDTREPAVREIDATFLDLAPFAISLPHGPARARRRFDVLSSLADQAQVSRLSRGTRGSPRQLADQVERALELQR